MSLESQLIAIAFTVFFIGLGMRRRLRPQPVRPTRIAITGAVITVLLALSLVSPGEAGALSGNLLGLALVPVFLAAGAALGVLLVRTLDFWTDPDTGRLWMKGGLVFALILLGTIGLRFAVRAALYGNVYGTPTHVSSAPHSGFLYDLSADFLFLTLGLWAARAVALVLRYRAHQQAVPVLSVER